MVMGWRTFQTIGRVLPGRRMIVLTSQPGAQTVEGVEFTNEEPVELLARLEGEGVQSLAVCGGAATYDRFMRAGVVSEVVLSVEPKLFGKGVPLFADTLEVNLSLEEIQKLNEHTVMIRYQVIDNKPN